MAVVKVFTMAFRRLHIGVRLATVALLIAGATAGSAVAGASSSTRYTGHFHGEKDSSAIAVKVVGKQGNPRYAWVRIRGLLFVCDDGTRFRRDYDWFRVPFVNDRLFLTDGHAVDTDFARLFVMRGTIVRSGRGVRGYVNEFRLYDPGVPHGDCATFSPARWHAARR